MTEIMIVTPLSQLEKGKLMRLHNHPQATVERVFGTLFSKTGDHVDQCIASGLKGAKSGVSRYLPL